MTAPPITPPNLETAVDILKLAAEEFAHFAGSPGNWPQVGPHTASAVHVVLAALAAEREALRVEREQWQERENHWIETTHDLGAKLIIAEATVERLETALIESGNEAWLRQARAALAKGGDS